MCHQTEELFKEANATTSYHPLTKQKTKTKPAVGAFDLMLC